MFAKVLFVLSVVYGVLGNEGVEYSIDENTDYYKFLSTYGYLEEGVPDDAPSDIVSKAEMQHKRDTALIAFQLYYGLPLTGKIDKETRDVMIKPRCGVPDIPKENPGGESPLPFAHLGTKWPESRLSWKINSFTRKLGGEQQRKTFHNAFKLWEDVTPLQINEVSTGKADMELSFGRYDHGDRSPFDGRGLTLAHAYGPGPGAISGDVHFDDDEDWSVNSDEGTDLLFVAAHEFGHSLGMDHSNQRDSLMYPSYTKGSDVKLAYDDIRGIQELYGSRSERTRQPDQYTARPPDQFTTRPPTYVTSIKPSPHPCNIDKVDQIVEGEDDIYYIFENDVVHTIRDGRLLYETRRIGDVFESAPSKPDMTFTTPNRNKIYIVKDSSVWRYTSLKLDDAYPKNINSDEFPEKPKFLLSFIDDNSRTRNLIFGSRKWWEYDFDNPFLYKIYSYNIDYYFYDMPLDIRFAVRQSDRNLFYLVTEDRYVILDIGKRSIVEDGTDNNFPTWIHNYCSALTERQINSAGITEVSIATVITTLVASILSDVLL